MSVSCTTGWASFSEGYAGSGRGGMVSAEEVADHPYDYADTFIRNTMDAGQDPLELHDVLFDVTDNSNESLIVLPGWI